MKAVGLTMCALLLAGVAADVPCEEPAKKSYQSVP
jgi:hypothetical protein